MRYLCLAVVLLALTTSCARLDGSRADASSPRKIDGIDVTVTIVTQPLADPRLDPIPAGFTPKVTADQALSRALAEIGWHPSQAHLYLGTGHYLDGGKTPEVAWVAQFTPAPCEPMFGPSPLPGITPSLAPTSSPQECEFGVVLDANTGAFVVES
jgi:hypothetical protein